jgi:hypothetical protein
MGFARVQTTAAIAISLLSARPEAAPLSLPFALDNHPGVVLPASVNGRTIRVLIDTGSNGSVIAESVSEQLHAPVVAQTSAVAPGGEARRRVVRLERVAIDASVSQSNLLAIMVPDRELRAAAGDVDGILGQDFLATFSYTIDYRARAVRWHIDPDAAADADSVRLALHAREGLLLAEIPPASAGAPVLHVVPDSGADVLVLFTPAAQSPLALDNAGRPVPVTGLAGGTVASLSAVTDFRLGRLSFRHWPVLILPPRQDQPMIDGLLPLGKFDRASFLPDQGVLVLRAVRR